MKRPLLNLVFVIAGMIAGVILGVPIAFIVFRILTAGRVDITALAVTGIASLAIMILQYYAQKTRPSYLLAVCVPSAIWTATNIWIFDPYSQLSVLVNAAASLAIVSIMYLVIVFVIIAKIQKGR